MSLKLLAVDLDGTLLRDDKTVSERNAEALAKLRAQGVYIIVSTGRAWPGARKYVQMIGQDIPVITSNGGMIVESGTEEILFRCDLEPETASMVLEEGRRRMVSQIIWSENRLYGLPVDWRLEHYGRMFGGTTASPMPSIQTLFTNGISKILWYDDEEHIAEWYADARDGRMFGGRTPGKLSICTSSPGIP